MHLYRRYLRSERITTLLYAVTLFLYAYFISFIFPYIGKIKALKDYMEILPPFLRAFFGEEIVQFTTLEGFLTVEFFNTTWIIILGIFTCLFVGSLVAEETEKRTLEITLSTPLRRCRFVLEKFLGFLTCLAVLVIASYSGILLGASHIHEKVNFATYNRVFFSGFLCMMSIGTIALFFSCIFNEQRRAVSVSLAFFLALYFFNIIAALLEQFPILRYLSLFNYYDASRIFVHNTILWTDLLVLMGITGGFFVLSLLLFERKEIYL